MKTPVRRRTDSGFSLIEVLVALGIVTLVMVPLFSWASLAFKQEAENQGRLKDTATASYIDRRFADDVASSTAVVLGEGCGGAAGLVRFGASDGTGVAYAYNASTRQVLRQVCGGTAEKVLDGVKAATVPTITCTPPADDAVDRCREVKFTATLDNTDRRLEIPARRRISGAAAAT